MVEIEERVFAYRATELEAWERGDRSVIPEFAREYEVFPTLSPKHFAEMLALRRYHEEAGWKGFSTYALGCEKIIDGWKPGLARLMDVAGRERLEELWALRRRSRNPGRGPGKPDLFLWHDDGRLRFAEVKRGPDRPRPAQLECIAQVLRVFPGSVDLVYVCEQHRERPPRRYAFDLERLEGWAVGSRGYP